VELGSDAVATLMITFVVVIGDPARDVGTISYVYLECSLWLWNEYYAFALFLV
jgi:hypothetical protein